MIYRASPVDNPCHCAGLMSSPVDGGDWISLGGVVIAGGAAFWSIISARRANAATAKAEHYQARAEQQAERATKAAEKAVVAQSASAAAAKRAADALEKQNVMAEAQTALDEGVPWRLQHQRGDTYELVNETATPKYGITVTGETIIRSTTFERIDGRSSVTFMALSAAQLNDHAIEVRWHWREDQSDEEQRWTGTKPPRPRR